MDFSFLGSIHPRIIDVVEREDRYWQMCGYGVVRSRNLLQVLAYVHRGKGAVELNGVTAPLHEGYLFQYGRGNSLSLTSSLEEPLCFYSIHFDYGTLRWAGEKGIWSHEDRVALPFPTTMPGARSPVLRESFKEALKTWREKRPGYEWYAKLGFMNILGLMSELQDRLSQKSNTSADAVRSAIEYVQAHLGEPLDRDTLARSVSLSPGYFSTVFKQYTGYTPVQYVTRLRMDRAKSLLRGSRMPIYEVARDVGFSDPFYFTKVFKRETGLSPSSYRKG